VEKVILWDFDGTLAARAGKWSACLVETLSSIAPGHPLSIDRVRPSLQSGFPWHSPDKSHVELRTADEWWAALLPLLKRAYLRAGVHEELATLATGAIRENYCDASKWTVFADSAEALSSLSRDGWRHAIVSNHVPELDELMEKLGVGQHFEHIINSSLAGWEKPNPKIFEIALEKIGHADRIWMIGDNPTADIEGARAVGIPGILVRSAANGEEPISLAEAAKIVRESDGSWNGVGQSNRDGL
jgi:putative hydrolase of the HAD superfamily